MSHDMTKLRAVFERAVAQAEGGKGKERHAGVGEAFEEQQIVRFGIWMKNTGFEIGQACKKALESARLPREQAIAELLGALNYLAAAVIVLETLPHDAEAPEDADGTMTVDDMVAALEDIGNRGMDLQIEGDLQSTIMTTFDNIGKKLDENQEKNDGKADDRAD